MPFEKYRPYPAVELLDRAWPDNRLENAPMWCSVDLRDGNADGKMSQQVLACPFCGRNTNSKRTTYVFCGESFHKPYSFDV